jgi:PAS domain S-box-containing protein
MASYLIVNVALFLSMAFIIHYYICKEPVFKHSPLKWRLILGFSYGCVSMVLMFFRYQVENGLVDLRHLPILLAAVYGGWASAIPAWIVASVARFFLLNQLGSYSIPILILALDAIIGVVLPQMIRSHHFKWVITLTVDVIMLTLILPQVLGIHHFGFWVVFAGVALLGGAAAFHLTESLRKSQQTLIELKKSQTDLENTIQHLDQIKDQLESFITHSADAIVILDIEERIIKVNPAFEKIFGWSAEEVIGCKPLPWIPIDQQEEASKLRRKTMTDGSVMGYEAVRLRRDGTFFPVSASVSAVFNRKGASIGFSAVYRDMTEKKQTEDLLRNSEKLSVVGELAAAIAHEIRNPLTTLKGFIQLIKKDYPSFYLDIMGDELERIEEITSEFLYLAKPLAVEIKAVSIRELLEQVMILLTPLAALNNIQLLIEEDGDLPMITCKVNEIKQVFINLIKNAIEAMPSGGEIVVTGRLEGEDTFLFSVIDQGIGIPKDRINKLGEPFYSLKEKGTGLGLTICKKIIQNHNGDISFYSKLGEGTVVHLTLPLS